MIASRLEVPMRTALLLCIPAALAAQARDSVTVQVRDYPGSPTVSVVAWNIDEDGFGLRGTLRRSDGTLVYGHRFYISTYFEPAMRSYHLATTSSMGLEILGVSRDSYACFYGRCSPMQAIGVRVPDDVLRANRDSLPIRFIGRGGRELTVTVYRDVIDAYLAKVDSLAAAIRVR